MNKIIPIAFVIMLITGCSDFLDTKSYTQKNNTSFPKTEADISQALSAVYSKLYAADYNNSLLMSNIVSDDQFGGGGTNDFHAYAMNNFVINDVNKFIGLWTRLYQGIFRANYVLENIDSVEWTSEAVKDQYIGEVSFMRAYYLYELGYIFGNVPMPISTNAENLPQAASDVLFGQIATDLKQAITKLPATPFSGIKVNEIGHATKWAAEGLLARVFLYYTGFYNKTDIKLTDGTSMSKNEVIGWVDDCIANSGHSLVPDYRNLWGYSYVNTYKFVKDNNLKWVGDGKGDTETLFSIVYSPLSKVNMMAVFSGFRQQKRSPFGFGYGFGTVNSQLYDEWPENDPRKKGSISNTKDIATEGDLHFQPELWNSVQVTGYYDKKNLPIWEWPASGPNKDFSNAISICVALYGANSAQAACNTLSTKIIRLADVLLMGAELGSSKAQTYLDRVRTRVGLPSVTVTLENIKKERRYELAFEGVRTQDLQRWHDAETAYAKVKDVPVLQSGVKGTVTINYRPEANAFFIIPNQEIVKSNGVLKQNPGWSSTPNFVYSDIIK